MTNRNGSFCTYLWKFSQGADCNRTPQLLPGSEKAVRTRSKVRDDVVVCVENPPYDEISLCYTNRSIDQT